MRYAELKQEDLAKAVVMVTEAAELCGEWGLKATGQQLDQLVPRIRRSAEHAEREAKRAA